jgi:hypothetical protein
MARGMARGTTKWGQSNTPTPQVMKSISNKERGRILERLSSLEKPSHIITCFKIEAACIHYNVINSICLSNECKIE